MSLLQVDGVDLYYGDAQALDQVSLHVEQGEIVAIIGTNGAGKTSLINAIGGALAIKAGTITHKGEQISGLPSYQVVNRGIAQVPEGRQLFGGLSVAENLRMGARVPRARAAREATFARMLATFPRLGERLDQAAGSLSGGEQQMVAIARCLMSQPDLILFDEPSLGLAPAIVQDVFRIIRALRAEQGKTIILVEQNVTASLKLADRAYVLENGRITLSGKADELLHDDRVRQAYMGV